MENIIEILSSTEYNEGKIILCVEATTLKHLSGILNTNKVTSWSQFEDVMNLIEMLLFSDYLVYSGRSEDSIKEETLENILNFSKFSNNDFFAFSKLNNSDYELSSNEGIIEYFDLGESFTKVHFDSLLNNKFDLSRAMPNKLPISLEEWNHFHKMSKYDNNNLKEWIDEKCYRDELIKNKKESQFNGGKAIFYAISNNSSSRELFLNMINKNPEYLADIDFLQFLNVSFRTFLNQNLANLRQKKLARNKHLFLYSPLQPRGEIYYGNNRRQFNLIMDRVRMAMKDSMIRNLKHDITQNWQFSTIIPFLALVVIEDAYNQNKRNPDLIASINKIKNETDLIKIRSLIVQLVKINSPSQNDIVLNNTYHDLVKGICDNYGVIIKPDSNSTSTIFRNTLGELINKFTGLKPIFESLVDRYSMKKYTYLANHLSLLNGYSDIEVLSRKVFKKLK